MAALLINDCYQGEGWWRFGFAEALSLTVALSIFFLPMIVQEKSVMVFFSPFWAFMAMVSLATVYWYPSRHMLMIQGLSSETHWLFSMLAHAVFTLWALFAVLYNVQSGRLHHPQDVGKLRQLPPLLAIERQSLWMSRATLFLLTLALISGFFYADFNEERIFRLNHKLLFSGLSWLGVLVIVCGQSFRHWRGQRVNYAVLACYGFLLLGYIGSQFVLEIILKR